MGSSARHRDDPEAGSRGRGREAPEGGAMWICVHMVYTGMCIHVVYMVMCIHVVYMGMCMPMVYMVICIHMVYTVICMSIHMVLEKAMAPHSSPLAWEIPLDGGAWWAAVHGVKKSQTQLSNFTFTFHFHALEKEMTTHYSVLAWRIPGSWEPGGLPSMGLHRVGHN